MPRDDEAANAPVIDSANTIAHEDDVNETQGLLHETRRSEQIYRRDGQEPMPVLFVWALTATAALSGLLFGYEYVHIRLHKVYRSAY
jgi:hypothetical protein